MERNARALAKAHPRGSATFAESSKEFRGERSTEFSSYHQRNAGFLILVEGGSRNTLRILTGSFDTASLRTA